MNVLSLFDGMSGAKLALDSLRWGVECTYYASEIDPYSESVSRYHYPDAIRLGDISKIKASDLPKIDLIIGGAHARASVCPGHRKGFKDPRGQLFFEFARLVEECKPKYFILENVKMKQEYTSIISTELKAEPVLINSALVTAQNRRRLYWTNFPVSQPKDRGIVLKDIIERGITDRDKSYCIDKSYFKGTSLDIYFNRNRRQLIFEPACLTEARTEEAKRIRREHRKKTGEDYSPRREKELVPRKDEKANCLTGSITKEHLILMNKPIRLGEIGKGGQGQRIYSEEGKSVTISAKGGGRGAKTGLYAVEYNRKNGVKRELQKSNPVLASNWRGINRNQNQTAVFNDQEYYIRKLTPTECERLQGVPDGFTALGINNAGNEVPISNTQRYKMLGNGFTVPVIEHILKGIL